MKNNKIKQLLIIILLICNQFMATAQVSGGVQLVTNQANSAGYADGDALQAKFQNYLTATATDSKGNTFIVDADNYCIRRLDALTNQVSRFAGTKSPTPSTGFTLGIDAEHTDITFAAHSLVIDNSDNVYFSVAGAKKYARLLKVVLYRLSIMVVQVIFRQVH